MFEIIDKEPSGTVIKVVGVGGAGGNAVEHMIREGVQGVEFICANTDAQALNRSNAHQKLQFGPGLGAGGKPEKARALADVERERIAEVLQGAHMAFITAGMGGGTGTGAAPIVAEVARELGILTVAVVTKPFEFENAKRMKVAEEGLAELARHVDSLIIILNERLTDVLGEDISMIAAFKTADNVLRNAVGGIAEIINVPGLVNVDFEDVRTVMGEMGKAMMGSAAASGMDRARLAAEQAVASPLLEGIELSGARGVLVNISANGNLGMKEVREVMNTIRAYAAEDAHIIFGTVFDEAMEDNLRVTVVATGLGAAAAQQFRPRIEVVAQKTGTDNAPIIETINYGELEVPAVMRSGRRHATVEAMTASGVDRLDIPAFLRKQAD
ncbi:MAG: cell division protein FtsZ [Burkholderiales bacterium]|uniref:Cell division protein FtsZ n=1 Tax=Candidatus Desulfobacillus denitrificans TaxID=2608985 RepID=A0A809QX23_9PROT|nr:cell division protein FtsZ [Rhodocyclaceae bacterium]MCZ2175153.1 cell division protein FtsZ [Burkholderiales bacterium]BBO19963.1 cell division protein FtsZ [Candidatus Desulfobacillus denitrificans]GIK46330.1 MAG: cell division protein FtsZ [Betaproteobacteria bacterium]MBV6411310.1 Cell division protein FtsZ [Rhodocyclaceae bacterium]